MPLGSAGSLSNLGSLSSGTIRTWLLAGDPPYHVQLPMTDVQWEAPHPSRGRVRGDQVLAVLSPCSPRLFLEFFILVKPFLVGLHSVLVILACGGFP